MNTTRTLIAAAAATLLSAPAFAQQDSQTTLEPGTSATASQSAGMGQDMQAMRNDPQTVRQIQQKLQDEGYRVGAIDGIWGPKTSSALKEFQQAQGLDADGALSQSTISALGIQMEGADSMSADRLENGGAADATGAADPIGGAQDGTGTTGAPRGAGGGQGAAGTGQGGAGGAGGAR